MSLLSRIHTAFTRAGTADDHTRSVFRKETEQFALLAARGQIPQASETELRAVVLDPHVQKELARPDFKLTYVLAQAAMAASVRGSRAVEAALLHDPVAQRMIGAGFLTARDFALRTIEGAQGARARPDSGA